MRTGTLDSMEGQYVVWPTSNLRRQLDDDDAKMATIDTANANDASLSAIEGSASVNEDESVPITPPHRRLSSFNSMSAAATSQRTHRRLSSYQSASAAAASLTAGRDLDDLDLGVAMSDEDGTEKKASILARLKTLADQLSWHSRSTDTQTLIPLSISLCGVAPIAIDT